LAVTTEGQKIESGLAPTGVLRQMPELHNSSQVPNIRPEVAKRQTRWEAWIHHWRIYNLESPTRPGAECRTWRSS